MNELSKMIQKVSLLMLSIPLFLNAQSDITFKSIKFFESGLPVVPQSERVYNSHFSKNDARYIYYEVEVDNNLYNIKDNPVTIYAKFYKPDGSVFGEPVLNYTIPSIWDVAYLWQGWGWKDASNWQVGTYRVVIYFDHEKVTESLFTIYDKYWTSSSASR